MRRVEFTDKTLLLDPDTRQYFTNTRYYTSISKYVGDYSGSDTTIADYTGPWPIIEDDIEYPTLKWLRNELGETAEFSARAYGLDSANPNYQSVQVFMDAVRDRANDVLIVTDVQYKNGVELLYSVGIIDQAKATSLLALGGHTLGG